MADDLDIEAMLEAPYRKEDTKAPSPNGQEERTKRKKRSRSHSRDRKRSRSRDRKRSRSRERKRSRSRDRRRSHSRSRERRRSRSRERGGRYRDHQKHRRRSRSKSPFRKEKSPIRQPIDNLTPEERDARTVFCMQLAARIRPRDLEEFFSAVGNVRDVRMISDRNSRRSKGIAYIEFVEANSVPLAIGLTGQRLLGVPIIVQASQAEKNRAAAAANNLQKGTSGPMRLYVGSLHFNITEEMLRGIFEPFGRIESIQLMMDSETGRSKGYGFITFADAECAKKALEQLNGFELAGRPMKVGHVTERTDASTASSFLDSDELERTGVDLGTTGRLQLMARLAEGRAELSSSRPLSETKVSRRTMLINAPKPSLGGTLLESLESMETSVVSSLDSAAKGFLLIQLVPELRRLSGRSCCCSARWFSPSSVYNGWVQVCRSLLLLSRLYR
ncbi:RNA-binding protein 39-like isoform X4 [Xiphias gladius]|uniref:RNA-binding protein 39-like isoform X4 n=1 Tax=Xiphias gladius TaxID=8245 RepID=UPI001A982FE9|nr:RNA-binding protein 39-like isoform X4 [Xiphias gladius]XP_039971531.1 RNA-binding protein 39-like isoform X4 [Xiphias gladius]